jgi:mono/diheme cytochrome c family protein
VIFSFHSTPREQVIFRYSVLGFLLLHLLLSATVFHGATFQEPLSPQEKRGKQIYVQGTSASGQQILAYLGDAALEVPGNSMACANCHGLDGKGKPEGGVIPSNLTWESLTKPYGVTRADGSKHAPYTERGIELAITRGLDPSGNKLPYVMPRYQMSSADIADLIAYLKKLGKDFDPGVSDQKIVIGTVVPAKGALGEMGEAIKAVTALNVSSSRLPTRPRILATASSAFSLMNRSSR